AYQSHLQGKQDKDHTYNNMCRPLMRIFTSNSSPELANLLTEFEEQPGDCFVLSNSLSAITMPERLLDRLLSRAGADGMTKEKVLSVQRARYKTHGTVIAIR
ncbi:MAG: hypothetical protein NUV41_16165, partial [Eubacteriales bacterium]|nr:hypothetical protein [Eubacteriales bacterium]